MANRSEPTLVEAVAEAIEIGSREVERLGEILAEAESRLRDAGKGLGSSGPQASDDGFFVLLDSVVSDLTGRLDASRRVSSTFNITFFGRTGAGKSTLLSALGRLNGELVSDGRSDFTTDVQPLDWNGCRLYDTPGINGWGRTRSRPDLEERAREAVEVADVVLLCFDSQSQQASEFRKVAEWVRAYRKPALAVLNMRNSMWRHPARMPTPAQREGLARQARQHADNIASELEAIGLGGVPVVAINSKRGLFARASTPFVGPAGGELDTERSEYGLEYLERWSNLPVLEHLVSACIVEGAADLRLAALREGFQAGLRAWADQIELVADHQRARGAIVEGVVAEWLNILGYPEPERRHALGTKRVGTDLLTQLEAGRGEPFTASVSGRLEGHVGHLLRSHLYPHRMRSLRAAEDLILEAFDDKRRISGIEFDSRVYDRRALANSIAAVAALAEQFVSANMEIASVNARIDLDLIDRSAIEVRGDTGIARRWVANLMRAAGLLSSGTSALLAALVATNFWNPAGWTAAAVLAGLGIVSSVATFVGRRTRKGAEEKRVAARANAVAEARARVNAYHGECENRQLTKIVEESWANGSPRLADMLEEALHTRKGCATTLTEAAKLREQANHLPPTTSPADVIQRATERMLVQTSVLAPRDLDAVLLGEDWVSDATAGAASDQLSERDRERFINAADETRAEFADHLAVRTTRAEPIGRWLEDAAASRFLDPQTQQDLAGARALLHSPPNVLIVGDYSSGKTSLIKRLLADSGAATPMSLRVEAGPASIALEHYRFGRIVLVDAPGFQSGQDDHDKLAVDASHDAALVIVVLHVNLLIGDISRLERLILGEETRVGKAARTVFVVGRIDEVGSDPRTAARDFLVRRQRKREELVDILESRGIVAEPRQVLTLSADPYGLVGNRVAVSSADYDSANRIWDGVSSLCEPLLELSGVRLADLSAEAALDRGRSALLSAQSRLRTEIEGVEKTVADDARFERLCETSLAELRLLEQSIERRTRRLVDDHAEEVLADALASGTSEVEVMSKRLESWWEDPRLASAVESLGQAVYRDLTDWSKRHVSEFNRELARLEFAMKRAESGVDADDGQGGGGQGVQMAAQVVNHAAGFVKAVGNRDAVYAIGKAFKVNFKPWGAVKAGAKVGKVGAVLGVVAVGFDIVAWVKDQKDEDGRERARHAAVEHVRSTTEFVVSSLLNEVDGPVEYVRQQDTLITENLRQLREESARKQRSADAARQRVDGMVPLQRAGEELAGALLETEAS